MIYLIGGPARCGKSTLAKRVRKEVDGQVITGDAFIKSLLDHLKPTWTPDIFVHAVDSIRDLKNDQAKLDRLRRRDKATWPFFESYLVEVAEQQSDDAVLEGNIWPDIITSFKVEHRAVFMIDTSSPEIQAERLIAIRDSGGRHNNWMCEWSDEKLQTWAHFNLLRSQLYAQLCRESHYPFFDIKENGIQQAQDAAFAYLLKTEI